MKEEYPREFQRWVDFEKEERSKIDDQMRKNQPTANQRKKMIRWDNVRNLPYKMPKGSFERLMVSLYVMTEPNRIDFSPCKVVRSDAERAECEANRINCIKLGKNGKGEICLAWHKTRQSHGSIRKPLPNELNDEIETSLEQIPRNWLFTSPNNPDKPWSKEYFRQQLAATFQKWIGISLGASTLRHAFISSLDFNRVSMKEVSQFAANMGHRTDTLRKYVNVLDT